MLHWENPVHSATFPLMNESSMSRDVNSSIEYNEGAMIAYVLFH